MAIELALSVVLLVGAGLMVRVSGATTAYPPGFSPAHVLTMRVQFSGPQYRDQAARLSHIGDLLRRARQAPGVEAAGVSTNGDAHMLLSIEGTPDVPPEERPRRVERGVRRLRGGDRPAVGDGRWLTGCRGVAGVRRQRDARAPLFSAGEDPVGKRIRLPWLTAAARRDHRRRRRRPAIRESRRPSRAGDLRRLRPAGAVQRDAGGADRRRSRRGGARDSRAAGRGGPHAAALRRAAARRRARGSVAPRRFNMLLLGTFAARRCCSR